MKNKIKHNGDRQDLSDLARQLANGNGEAIALIYRRYFHKLLYYSLQVVGRDYQNEAEDVIQEFFIWLAENPQKLNHIRDFETYLFQSIRRNLQSKLGTQQTAQATFERFVHRTATLQESINHSPEQLHIQKEEQEIRRTLIQQELDKLPPYLKEVLYLRYFEERSYPEIAAILEVSDQVAYNYVFRAIKRLKKQLTDLKIFLFLLYGLVKMIF